MNKNILDILNLLQNVSLLSQNILTYIEEDKINNALLELNNRERLINLLNSKTNMSQTENINPYNMNEVQLLLEQIRKEDELIILRLEEIKKSTNQEIAKLFKTKEGFKGYNLKNLR